MAHLLRGTQVACPNCNSRTLVIETGWSTRWRAHTRRRACLGCNTQFYTQEVIVPDSAFKVHNQPQTVLKARG